jgi:hypothetical protein
VPKDAGVEIAAKVRRRRGGERGKGEREGRREGGKKHRVISCL